MLLLEEKPATLLLSRAVVIAVVLGIVSACSGGSGGELPMSVQNAAPNSGASLLVEIIVPARGTTASSARYKNYFSPATQSVVITAVGPSPLKTKTTAYVNVNPSNPACTGYDSTTCTVSLGLNVSGTYTLTFLAFDHSQSSNKPPFAGRPLATNQTQLAFVAGKTKTYTVALDGIPAYFTISPNGNGYLQGSRDGLTLYGGSTQQVTVISLDHAGDPIIGPGAPVIGLASSSASLTVVPVGSGYPTLFNINAKTSGSPAVVSPEIVYLTASAAQPLSSGAGSAATTVPVQIAHSVITITMDQQVIEWLDGNTSPSITIPTSCCALPAAMDRSGNVFVAIFATITQSITEYPAGTNSPTLLATLGNQMDYSPAIAVDLSGKIYWAYYWHGGILNAYPRLSIYAFLPGSTSFYGVYGADQVYFTNLAVDAAGALYISGANSDANGQILNGVVMTPTAQIITGPTNLPGALAVDGNGTTYVAFGGTINEYPRGSSIPNRTLSGLSNPSSIAVDVGGTVYVTDAGKGGVAEFPSGYTRPSVIVPLSGAKGIAVLPSSAFSI